MNRWSAYLLALFCACWLSACGGSGSTPPDNNGGGLGGGGTDGGGSDGGGSGGGGTDGGGADGGGSDGGGASTCDPQTLVIADTDYSFTVEAEQAQLVGSAEVAAADQAFACAEVRSIANGGDGISLILTEAARSVTVHAYGDASLTLSVDGAVLAEITLDGERGGTRSVNGDFRAGATLTINATGDTGSATIDALQFNRFSVENASFGDLSTLYQHGGEYGDSALFDQSGNLLVSGGLNHDSVLRIEPDGSAATALTSVYLPVGMVYDSQGNFYVANCLNDTIGRVDSDGNYSTFTNVTGCPASILIDADDNLIVSSYFGNRVVRIDPIGNVSVIVEGQGLNNPVGLAFDEDGQLYVANWTGGRLFRVDENALVRIADFGTRVNQIAYLNGYIYAPLRLVNRVDRAHLTGDIDTFIGAAEDNPVIEAQLDGPYGVAVSMNGASMAIVERDSGTVSTVLRE